jgi:hypothetical protein
LSDPLAARAPVAKIRESPGKKGVITRPVSQKTITNNRKYISRPYSFVIALKCVSRCMNRSIEKFKFFICTLYEISVTYNIGWEKLFPA